MVELVDTTDSKSVTLGCEGSSPSLATVELIMESVIVEIRAGEGGADAKLLVSDQFAIYAKLVNRSCL